MSSQNLPSKYHDRLLLTDYGHRLEEYDLSELDTGGSDSPSQVWARELRRSGLDLSGIDQVPVELLVWGRGEPGHPAATKIGGKPAWPADKSLPVEERNDWEIPAPLRFFGQFNFADTADILPDLPGSLLSVWGTEEFPFGEDSIQTFWLEADGVEKAHEYSHPFTWDFMPVLPFHACLHRSWDPSRRQQLLDEIDPPEATPENSCALSWMGSKFGGTAAQIQPGSEPDDCRFLLQMNSIEPANHFPHPWVNHAEPFTIKSPNGKYDQPEDELILSDGGALYFYLTAWGSVVTKFEFH